MKRIDKKKLILDFLSEKGRSSTTRIADAIKANQPLTERHLEELRREGRVKRMEETMATYWDWC